MINKHMYGFENEQELDLCFHHEGNYKGWKCFYTGGGTLEFKKVVGISCQYVSAYRGVKCENWVWECWNEIKEKIDLWGGGE